MAVLRNVGLCLLLFCGCSTENSSSKDGSVALGASSNSEVTTIGQIPAFCDLNCVAQDPSLCVRTGDNKCVQCVSDDQCQNNPAAKGARCDREKGECVCTTDKDCEGISLGSHCKNTGLENTCSCLSDRDCETSPGLVCGPPNASTKVCRQKCSSDAECRKEPGLPFCDVQNGFCAPCLSDGDCKDPHDRCLRAPGTNIKRCLNCRSDSDCRNNPMAWGPYCEGNACKCRAAEDCRTNGNGAACNRGAQAGQCNCASSDECKVTPYNQCLPISVITSAKACKRRCSGPQDCMSNAPFCDSSSGQCRECVDSDGPCKNPLFSHCKKDRGRCVGCTEQAHCEKNFSNRKCDLQKLFCVQCLSDPDCKAINRPGDECLNGVCLPKSCKNSDDCNGNENGPICDPTAKRCSCTNREQCSKISPGLDCKAGGRSENASAAMLVCG